MKKVLTIIVVFIISIAAYSQEKPRPYNENQDVRADLKKVVDKAAKEHKHVLVQFGGNWCPWCLRFHAMANGAQQVDSLLKADYVYILANVPKEKNKRDWSVFRDYGYPNRFGFPVFVILDGTGKELHIQDSGLLEHPKVPGYDTAKVVSFLKMWNVRAVDPKTYPVK
jgi:thioredoxin-related protein